LPVRGFLARHMAAQASNILSMITFCALGSWKTVLNCRGLIRKVQRFGLFAALNLTVAATGWCQNARFDLTGPKVEVRVTRGAVTLPIASVPNLQPGDKLWVHPDLPASQSVHYLMVVTFLRGTTNPPPENWFTRIATWEKKVRQEGVVVTVPDEAQQAVLFLAPVTGGDFSTLRSAVQGRPGIFVRASQDLAAAGFEQARIEKYIESMKQLTPAEAADPKQLQEHSNFLASTLALKPNGDCVRLPADQQYTCLTQSGSQNLLDDGHGQSIVDALTSGTSAGLIGTVSTTQLAGGGVYSAYVGAVVDLVHIMGSLHTAQYQYIPAIAFPEQQAMNLRLNTPPSFHNPKSVIVIGLPSVQHSVPPPLRASDPKRVSCLVQPDLVLPVEGAPLVFSTGFAHDLVLHVNDSSSSKDIPLIADSFRGGLVVAPHVQRRPLAIADQQAGAASAVTPPTKSEDGHVTGTIEGYWGFDQFTGPTMPLQNGPGKDWKVSEDGWLIAGKHGQVVLTSTGTACVREISIEPATGERKKQDWKQADKPNTVDVTVDVPDHASGAMHLAIRQYGDPKPDTISLVAYGEPAKIDGLQYHAGDEFATLQGSGFDQVRTVEIDGVNFQPVGKGTGGAGLQVAVSAGAARPKLAEGASAVAHVTLQDGRSLPVKVRVEQPRPSLTLISRVRMPVQKASDSMLQIKLSSDNDLPISDELVFSVKSNQPFVRNSAIEVASPDDSLHAKLSLEDAARESKPALVLQDPKTLVATVQPQKLFGRSAFGPIRFRAVAPDGTTGDWIPLATLVRLPSITGLTCQNAKRAAAVGPTSGADSAAEAPAAAPPAAATPAAPSTATAPGASAVAPAPASAAALAPAASCTLTGSDLFLIDSVSATESDPQPVKVPEGFVGASLQVPAPTGAAYYIRLRDDPSAVDAVSLPAGPL
jgi:hypothetical protein